MATSATTQLGDKPKYYKFKYDIGDLITGSVNIFYIEKRDYVYDGYVQGAIYVPVYTLINPILNKRFKYREKDIDAMLAFGHKLQRNTPNPQV